MRSSTTWLRRRCLRSPSEWSSRQSPLSSQRLR
jgi:hypothetical protein